MSPVRFAYLFERFPSFVQTFVYREAVEMLRQGANPWLVSIRRPDDPGELVEKIDAEVFYLPEEKTLRSEVDDERSRGAIRGKARKAIPIHRGERDSQRMFEAIWLAPQLEKRGIRHVHAHFGAMAARTAWWLKKLFDFTYSFTGHANDIFCDTDFPISNAELAKHAAFIVTETDYARRWMEERHPSTIGKVFRVFNGIEPRGFFDREPRGNVPRILSVGRYVEKKGFEVLIGACAELRSRGISFECEIVGEGPLRDILAKQIDDRGLVNIVKLAGPRSQSEVRRLLSQSQLFVLASQPDSEGGSDNLPTVIAEAMFAGVPCLSTKLAGIPEMIQHGETGLLVPPRDTRALSDAMAQVLDDGALAERLGSAAKRKAESVFTIEQSVRELRTLLQQKAGGPRRRWWPWASRAH
jgi:glycosyltransferase involved in cell wall biosynthesis